MKILDIPKSGKCGVVVAFRSRFGLCLRELVIPKKTITPARERVWSAMGYFARAWSAKLTEAQRERWIVGGANVLSATRFDSGPLTGQQFFESINCARACIGQPPIWEAPPPRPAFSPSPVGQATVVNGEQGLRLLLAVTGPVTEDIMVFGQAPCSTGRHKRRNVAYLGLLPPPEDGVADITDLYVARYGPLRPQTKIFLVTRQQKNGWESPDKETCAVVPGDPEGPQSTVPSPQSGASGAVLIKTEGQQAPAKPSSPLSIHMYTGGTRDAHRTGAPRPLVSREGNEPLTWDVKAARSASEADGGGART